MKKPTAIDKEQPHKRTVMGFTLTRRRQCSAWDCDELTLTKEAEGKWSVVLWTPDAGQTPPLGIAATGETQRKAVAALRRKLVMWQGAIDKVLARATH